MGFLIEPLAITLPVGAFNGSSIVDRRAQADRAAFDPPVVAQRSLDPAHELRRRYLAVQQRPMVTDNPDGEYVSHEKHAIKADPTIITDFTPHLAKPARSSAPARTRRGCSDARRRCRSVGARHRRALADLLSRRHAARSRQGHLRRAMTKRLGIPTDAVATIGDMENDLPMLPVSGVSIAMGNAPRHQAARDACQGAGATVATSPRWQRSRTARLA